MFERPLLDEAILYSRRLPAAVRAFKQAENATLSERFSAASKVLKASEKEVLQHMVSVPYNYLVKLFDFKNQIYITLRTQTCQQALLRNYFDLLVTNSHVGPLRALFANPKQFLEPPNFETIYEDDEEEKTICSAAVLAHQDKIHEDHRELLIVIRDAFDNVRDIYKTGVFAMHGVALPGGEFRFYKIIVPSFDPVKGEIGPMTLIDVNDHDAVSRALAYAIMCKEAIRKGQDLNLPYFLNQVHKTPYNSRALPDVPQLPTKAGTPQKVPA